MASSGSILACIAIVLACFALARAQLDPCFYNQACPKALPTIKMVVEQAIAEEPRMGASLLRLHFHDCFVNGCDGSILLDDTPTFIGEKNAAPNQNSARGFEVVDRMKQAVNSVCGGNVVSCADILAVAARDSIDALGGPSYDVQVGRRDARTASQAAANNSIPAPTLDLSGLLSKFQAQGLSMKDLVALSGGHTIGFARCTNFRSRLYNETNTLSASVASSLMAQCPISGGDNNLSPLDAPSPTSFDTDYYDGLLQQEGLLHSDQQLYKGDGSPTDGLVKLYAENPAVFWQDFAASMIKMGSISPLTRDQGEIRINCRMVN